MHNHIHIGDIEEKIVDTIKNNESKHYFSNIKKLHGLQFVDTNQQVIQDGAGRKCYGVGIFKAD